jgi:hypothetical protein
MTSTQAHEFSSPAKDSQQLAYMALALSSNTTTADAALLFFQRAAMDAGASSTREFVLSQISAKMAALERWNESMPGYGGFLPWYTVNASTGDIQAIDGWANPYKVRPGSKKETRPIRLTSIWQSSRPR